MYDNRAPIHCQRLIANAAHLLSRLHLILLQGLGAPAGVDPGWTVPCAGGRLRSLACASMLSMRVAGLHASGLLGSGVSCSMKSARSSPFDPSRRLDASPPAEQAI